MEFFNFIIAGVTALAIKVAPKVAAYAISVIKDELRAIFPDTTRSHSQARQEVSVSAEEISDIDNEICQRQESFERSPNTCDKQAIEELEILKKEKYEEYQSAQGESVKQEIAENPGKFAESRLREGNENKLLYHTGLITLKKKCPSCGQSMRLQHKTINDPKYSDFFWQCIGYYAGGRCRTISFNPNDIDLFHRSDIEEIEIDNRDLITIASERDIQKDIDDRLRGHIGKVDVDILCPIHLTPMQLRKKNASSEIVLLDKYHLRCKNPKCSQTTKLKSYPQLAAYLRRTEGSGILS